MKTVKSPVPFDYRTIKVTQSRIDKGLLAIPLSLVDFFPHKKGIVHVCYGMGNVLPSPKNYTPYQSSSRECRIGGMRRFFCNYQVKDGDEIVIQVLDKNTYRLIPEKQFHATIGAVEVLLDEARTEEEVSRDIRRLSRITLAECAEVALGEYLRLSRSEFPRRRILPSRATRRKESVSPSLKRILGDVYGGKCQVTGFGFLMKNGNPYFEIHHLRPELGSHVKNLLVVCPNVHAQFTYAKVRETRDEQGWLRRVQFSDRAHGVFHVADTLRDFVKEIHWDLLSGP